MRNHVNKLPEFLCRFVAGESSLPKPATEVHSPVDVWVDVPIAEQQYLL
ncbi:hypothetical protein JNB11_05670 [Kocuria palustris]|nr:hypothetical protein [Kocuria palustris]